MGNFLIRFLISSILGLLFFRPLLLKREVEIELSKPVLIDSVYYYHGFPIRTLVKDVIRNVNGIKEYNIVVEPVKGSFGIFRVWSDVDLVKNYEVRFEGDWKNLHGFYIMFLSKGQNNKGLEFKVKARDYIYLLSRSGLGDTLSLKISGKSYKFPLFYINRYSIDLRKPKSLYKLQISPESNEIVLKLKEDVKNLRIKNYNYEILDSKKILIKNLGFDYFRLLSNAFVVIIYSLLLSIVLAINLHFLRVFSIIFTIFLIYYLSYFPGIYSYDVWHQILEAYSKISDWYTPFHTLTILITLKLFQHIGAYVLIQIIFTSILFAWILSKLQIKNEILITILFSFPITSLMLICAWKDTYFSLSLIWFSSLLYFAYIDRNYLKNNFIIIAFIISASLTILLRYNGIPLIFICLILMCFLFKEHLKRIILIVISTILIFVFFQIVFYKMMKIEKTPYTYQKDIYALASYIAQNFPFSQNERELIERIMPISEFKRRYNCKNLVGLVWHGYFNWEEFQKNGSQIRKILINSIFKDIRPLIKHIACSSSYIYNPFTRVYVVNYRDIDFIEINVDFVKLYPDFKLPQIQNIIEKITDLPTKEKLLKPILIFYKPPIYLYFLLFIFLYSKNLRILTIPSFINTLILILISVDNDFRYLYPNYLISIIIILYFSTTLKSYVFVKEISS